MRLRISIGLALVLTATIIAGPITQKVYAVITSNGSSSGASGGSLGQSSASGGAGSNVGGVDRHLFCNTGVITPVCK